VCRWIKGAGALFLVMLCAGCAVKVLEVKPIHIADPPPLGAGTGTNDDPVEVGQDVSAPTLIYSPEANYTDAARRKKEACTVSISVVVTQEGTVRDALVTDSCPDLDASALKTVKTYRFKPAMRDGKPVAVRVMVQVGFTIY
jgi:TonB family protein